jgi:hypothetical protein
MSSRRGAALEARAMHIPTTYTGSLPRPDSVLRLLYERMEEGTSAEVQLGCTLPVLRYTVK